MYSWAVNMILSVLGVFLIFLPGYHMAQASEAQGKLSSYQSGADPEYISDEFKFSHPKDWKVSEFGEDGGAIIDFAKDQRSSMSVDLVWQGVKYPSIDGWSKDLKRRFGKNILFHRIVKVNGRDALLYHLVPDKPNLESTEEDIWSVFLICSKYPISIGYLKKNSASADGKLKNSQTPPKVFQELLDRFKCIEHKSK